MGRWESPQCDSSRCSQGWFLACVWCKLGEISRIYRPSRVAWWGCWSQKLPTVPVLLMELLSPGPVSLPNIFFGNGWRLHKLFATVAIGKLVTENIVTPLFCVGKGWHRLSRAERTQKFALFTFCAIQVWPVRSFPFRQNCPSWCTVCAIYACISRQKLSISQKFYICR